MAHTLACEYPALGIFQPPLSGEHLGGSSGMWHLLQLSVPCCRHSSVWLPSLKPASGWLPQVVSEPYIFDSLPSPSMVAGESATDRSTVFPLCISQSTDIQRTNNAGVLLRQREIKSRDMSLSTRNTPPRITALNIPDSLYIRPRHLKFLRLREWLRLTL